MDYSNIIIAICTAIGTIVSIVGLIYAMFSSLSKKIDKMGDELKDQGQRLSRIEGYLEGRDIGKRTGTEK